MDAARFSRALGADWHGLLLMHHVRRLRLRATC